jgi:hypothetical protein
MCKMCGKWPMSTDDIATKYRKSYDSAHQAVTLRRWDRGSPKLPRKLRERQTRLIRIRQFILFIGEGTCRNKDYGVENRAVPSTSIRSQDQKKGSHLSNPESWDLDIYGCLEPEKGHCHNWGPLLCYWHRAADTQQIQ